MRAASETSETPEPSGAIGPSFAATRASHSGEMFVDMVSFFSPGFAGFCWVSLVSLVSIGSNVELIARDQLPQEHPVQVFAIDSVSDRVRTVPTVGPEAVILLENVGLACSL